MAAAAMERLTAALADRYRIERELGQVENLSSRPIEVFENWWDPKRAEVRR